MLLDSVSPSVISSVSRSASIGGIEIDALDFRSVVDAIVERAMEARENAYVVTPNAHHVGLLQHDLHLREIYKQAMLVVPDGVSLLWAAKLLRNDLVERVNGTDLLETICARAETHGLRIFFLGGRDGAAQRAAEILRRRHPRLVVCGTYCPAFGFEHDPAENTKIIETINAAGTDILFVGLGAPKQEYWMYAHRNRLEARVSLGIGVSFEFVAGIVKRAPRFMQMMGLEWFFRLICEPRRLWKRYIIGNLIFCLIVARQCFAKP